MITATELRTKIETYNTMKTLEEIEQNRIKAKDFVETVIAPIIINLHRMPDHLFIGYMLDNRIYTRFTQWEHSTTPRGNAKCSRTLANEIGYFPFEDCRLVNEYLLPFGFQIEVSGQHYDFATYSSRTPDDSRYVYEFYLTITDSAE